MHRIDGPGATVDKKFTEGNPSGGVQATGVGAAWLNDIQEELMSILTAAGIAPIKGVQNQVLTAIQGIVSSGRLLRTTIYINNAGTLQKSVDGSAFANAASTFTPHGAAVFGEGLVIAGGGSGGGAAPTTAGQIAAGSGGGGGGHAKKRAPIGSFTGATIVVGLGGTPTGGLGVTGGASSIGSLVSATGGNGGTGGPAATPNSTPVGGAPGGIGSNGDLNGAGGPGGWAIYSAVCQSGAGGGSFFGPGPISVGGVTGIGGTAAVNYGAGGSGGSVPASQGGAAGGAGKAGLVIIQEFA